MNWIENLFSNRVLITGLLSWATAQIIKAVLFAVINRRFDVTRLFGDGGMPSCHSATVTGMAVSSAIVCGPDSPVFAISAIVAVIVMHDAMGVRLETGKQAKLLNELTDYLKDSKFSNEEKLKEFVGHTPIQVLCGGLVGMAVALIVNVII